MRDIVSINKSLMSLPTQSFGYGRLAGGIAGNHPADGGLRGRHHRAALQRHHTETPEQAPDRYHGGGPAFGRRIGLAWRRGFVRPHVIDVLRVSVHTLNVPRLKITTE